MKNPSGKGYEHDALKVLNLGVRYQLALILLIFSVQKKESLLKSMAIVIFNQVLKKKMKRENYIFANKILRFYVLQIRWQSSL